MTIFVEVIEGRGGYSSLPRAPSSVNPALEMSYNFIDASYRKIYESIKLLRQYLRHLCLSCRYCGSLVENAEHTLFVCARWGAKREAVGRAVGVQLTPDTHALMLQSEQIWMLIGPFVTLVMKTRELDGRAERGNKGGE